MANCYPASTLNMQIIIWPSTSAPVASRIREISKGTDSLSDNREPMYTATTITHYIALYK